ncbi:uncharacterized protein LTR77_002640 [Saxophila tyrrhenica]|uniref:ubiquitinyl hydrolase 1 n=1 Tax=Saxophila tyrrhenica TaxID=1690608 RepID=A0AAV9PIU8_9PEZI|nr:hypothetical protein LTR77_002640 [Saxophila tyrrhenica]
MAANPHDGTTRSGRIYTIPFAFPSATTAAAPTPTQPQSAALARAQVDPKSKPWKVIKGAGRVTKFPSGLRYRRPARLHNPHHYCYRRSLLQCLAHLPAVYNYLGAIPHQKTCDLRVRRCTVCALQTFVNKYWNEKHRTSFPHRAAHLLDRAIWHDGPGNGFPDATTTRQGDPHEFFLFLQDRLDENEHRLSNRLNLLFNVHRDFAWTCEDCGGINSGQMPVAYDLKLDMAQSKDWVADLDNYIMNEFTGGYGLDASCQLPACTAQLLGAKERVPTYEITQSPEVLVATFTRQEYAIEEEEGTGEVVMTQTKIKLHVDYPEHLDLSSYTADG